MVSILIEWTSWLVRWLHVMAGITWIGTSFYFNWFDSLVRKTDGKTVKENNRGVLEEIHGGSFYYHEQYWPDTHPKRLLVHAWPAKTTFLSGLLLLALVYWVSASTYLVSGQSPFGPEIAILISAASIPIAWFYYNTLCKLTLKINASNEKVILVGMAIFVLASAFIFQNIFGGRAAYISVGVMLGSIMGLNVWTKIVPNHIAMRKQLNNGEKLNTDHGYLAKRHSQHNNYLTLPVVITMISNHFATAYQHKLGWVILFLLMFAGWGIRHSLNILYKEERKFMALNAAIVIAFVGAVLISLWREKPAELAEGTKIDDTAGMAILKTHCAACHSANPTFPGFEAPPQGLALDTPAEAKAAKEKVILRTTVTKDMPLGNLTNMTEEERSTLVAWLESGN